MSIINERIKKMRLYKNLTLLEVAEFLNVKEATAQRYESGEIKNIKHETIIALANIFNCSPAYLMGWEDDPLKTPASDKSVSSFDLNISEKEHIKKYRALTPDGKKTVDLILDNQYEQVKSKVTDAAM